MADTDSLLLKPTPERVRAECEAFDLEPSTRLVENVLLQLRECFPTNTDPGQVMLKVIALNRLYSARVLDKDTEKIALSIAACGVDPLLKEGSPNAVETIIQCGGGRRYYSFATKFCSWHNPTAYAIYDGNVNESLWQYRKRDKFTSFRRDDLYDYEKLTRIIRAFQEYYGLQEFTLREMDKCLWRVGDRLLNPDASR